MATLCFGGSFNPIHHGHLIGARSAAESGGFDRVLLIPSAVPPHKDAAQVMATAEDRIAMCRLAISGDPFFAVSAIELERSGPSYTVDTVRALNASTGQPVHWLIGADMLPTLPTWHKSEELLAIAHLHFVARPGWSIDWHTLPTAVRRLEGNRLEAPLIEISASDIRRRVAMGKAITFLTPPAVASYIADKGLYRGNPR